MWVITSQVTRLVVLSRVRWLMAGGSSLQVLHIEYAERMCNSVVLCGRVGKWVSSCVCVYVRVQLSIIFICLYKTNNEHTN